MFHNLLERVNKSLANMSVKEPRCMVEMARISPGVTAGLTVVLNEYITH